MSLSGRRTQNQKGPASRSRATTAPTLVDRHDGYILFPFNNFTFSLFSSLELFLSCLTQPTTHSTPLINKTLVASTPLPPNSQFHQTNEESKKLSFFGCPQNPTFFVFPSRKTIKFVNIIVNHENPFSDTSVFRLVASFFVPLSIP